MLQGRLTGFFADPALTQTDDKQHSRTIHDDEEHSVRINIASHSNMKPPILKDVNIAKLQANALYDSGSSVCLISENFLSKCNVSEPIKKAKLKVLTVTGSPIDILGEITLPVNLLGKRVIHKF